MRQLTKAELPLLWTIDRREFIANIYRLQDGQLVLEPHDFDVPGWAPGKQEADGAEFEACFERGGKFFAAFDGNVLAGIAVIDSKRVGRGRDLVELRFLHVGRDYRGQGLGAALFSLATEAVRTFEALGLYISATPSENTVHFYQRRGCTLTQPDEDLFLAEPEDIHLQWRPS